MERTVWPHGSISLVPVDGVATATTINLRPAANEEFLILAAWGYTDAVGGATLNWRFYDGMTIVDKPTRAMAAAELLSLFNSEGTAEFSQDVVAPVRISYQTYVQLIANALAAGEKIYIRALVYKSHAP